MLTPFEIIELTDGQSLPLEMHRARIVQKFILITPDEHLNVVVLNTKKYENAILDIPAGLLGVKEGKVTVIPSNKELKNY